MKSSEREPQIGLWWTFCCIKDLDTLNTEDEVYNARVYRKSMKIRVWETEDAARAELTRAEEVGDLRAEVEFATSD